MNITHLDCSVSISHILLKDTRLNIKTIGVYAILCAHKDDPGATLTTLSKYSGLSVDGLKTAMRELKKYGYLSYLHEKGEFRITSTPECLKSDILAEKRIVKMEVKSEDVEEKVKKFIPPTKDGVYEYFRGRGVQMGRSVRESEKFIAFYSSKGWKVGNAKMVSWKGAAAGWYERLQEENTKTGVKTNAGELIKQKYRGANS